jgi:hypothetical protein
MDRILALPQDGLCTITERAHNMQGTKAHGQESVVTKHSNPSKSTHRTPVQGQMKQVELTSVGRWLFVNI